MNYLSCCPKINIQTIDTAGANLQTYTAGSLLLFCRLVCLAYFLSLSDFRLHGHGQYCLVSYVDYVVELPV